METFVKCEKLNFTSKDDPAPRVIQPRAPEYNVELGRYIKHLERPLFKSLESFFGYPVVFKGHDANVYGQWMRAHWDNFRNPVAIGLDASRFD